MQGMSQGFRERVVGVGVGVEATLVAVVVVAVVVLDQWNCGCKLLLSWLVGVEWSCCVRWSLRPAWSLKSLSVELWFVDVVSGRVCCRYPA